MPLPCQRRQPFAHRVPRTPSAPGAGASECEFKFAENDAELMGAFRLLYQEYLRAGYVRECPTQLLCTRHHRLSSTTVLMAGSAKTAVSTATLFRDSGPSGLPMDELYARELDPLRRCRRRILEIGSLASDASRFSLRGIREFINLVFLYAVFQDADDLCIMVNPRHVRVYQARFGFEVFGPEKHYSRVNAPAVALHLDIPKARGRVLGKDSAQELRERIRAGCLSQGIAICRRVLAAIAPPEAPAPDSPTLPHGAAHPGRQRTY